MFKKIEKYKDYTIRKGSYKIYENKDMNASQKADEVLARKKVNKAIVWINVNRGFFGKLLGALNIYGSSQINPKTMCTNGLNITYHPEFVLGQSKGAINFVLCHEILHCVGDHMTRRGTRDPQLWNYACDYAINPILDQEVGRDFEWPKNPDGSRMGLLEAKYSGWRAEDIYDDLVKQQKEGKLKMPDPDKWSLGDVEDGENALPAPDSEDSIVQDVRVDEIPDGEGDPKPASGGGQKVDGDGEGDGESGTNLVGKTVTVTDGPNKGMTGVVKEVLPNGDIVI